MTRLGATAYLLFEMALIWVRLMFYEDEIQVLHFRLFPAGPVGAQAVGSSPAGHANLGHGDVARVLRAE